MTVRARNMPELRKKLLALLGETESDTTVQEEDFPKTIKSIFPDFKEHLHGAIMLTLLHEKHQGKQNAVDSLTLAKEMVDRFPRLLRGKTVGKVSAGNVFAGNALLRRKLIYISLEKDENSDYEYRVYWV